MTITLNALQKQRRDTASNWTSNNTVLLAGEFGYETDTEKLKIGDGSTAWQSLDYLPIPDTNRLLTGNLTVGGNFTVNGTTTTIDTTTLTVEDKNIEIGKVSTPSDTTADGGGITLKGATDKTINWVDSTDSWTFSEHLDLASGKVLKVAGTEILSATTLGSSVVSSSLTSVGTIATGTWNATAIASSKLAKPIDFADNEKARFGTGNDFEIYHDGTSNYLVSGTGLIRIRHSSEDAIITNENGKVELYYDNSKKFETISDGVSVEGITYSNGLIMDDNHIIKLGTGRDLQIYHDGSKSVINDIGTGHLEINTNNLRVQNAAANETLLYCTENGSVQLYHDNSLKLSTASAGVNIAGNLNLNSADNYEIRLGANNDLELYHDGTDTYVSNATGDLVLNNIGGNSDDIFIRSADDIFIKPQGGEDGIKVIGNGAVELYHDGVKKFETTSTGAKFSGKLSALDGSGSAGSWIALGDSDDLQIYHNGSHSYILNTTGVLKIGDDSEIVLGKQSADVNYIKAYGGGAVELYYDNSKKLQTDASGVTIGGLTYERLRIDGQVGDCILSSSGAEIEFTRAASSNISCSNAAGALHINVAAGDSAIKCLANSGVELYHNGSKKFETTSTGTTTTGNGVLTGLVAAAAGLTQFDNAQSLISQSSVGSSSQTYFIGNQSIQTSSDRRIKENIIDTVLDALSELKKVRVVDFNWNDPSDKAINNKNSRGKWTGCIAQEIVNVFPFAVNAPRPEGKEIDNDSEALWGMEYGQLVPVLIKGLQELHAKLETLESKVAVLESG